MARPPRHAPEGGFGELVEVVGVLAGVDDPQAVPLARELKAIAGPHALDFNREAAIAVHLGEGVHHRLAGLAEQADNRDLGKLDRLGVVERQRGIAGEVLRRPHERHVTGKRNAVILVPQVLRIDSRALGERRLADPRDRELHQAPGDARADGELRHRSNAPCNLRS